MPITDGLPANSKWNSALLLAIAPFVLAIASGVTSSASHAEEAGGPAAPSSVTVHAPEATCTDRLLDPLRILAGGVPSKSKSSPSPSVSGVLKAGNLSATFTETNESEEKSKFLADAVREFVDAQKAFKITSVRVATVADPVDSGLRYHYETTLRGLFLGMERLPTGSSTSFNRDRAWLPWDDRARTAEERAKSLECRHDTPGLAVFRGMPDPHDHDHVVPLALLLLVGESPTTGVHQAAFANAIAIQHRLNCDKCESAVVIGPVFSGSATSVVSAIALAQRPPANVPGERRFHFFSGTASGSDVPKILEPFGVFRRTTIAQPSLECAFLRFARDHLGVTSDEGGEDGRGPEVLGGVAMLRESGTEFGGQESEDDVHALVKACGVRPEVTLSFPFHVSAVRDAYETLDAKHKSKDSSVGRATSLDVSLQQSSKPLDVEAEPSRETTIAVDASLSQLMMQISREGTRYVGIRATDVADGVFLARKIRDVAPDVRLVFFDADVLLTHPDLRRDLLGSLVVSAYPFFGADDFSRRHGGRTLVYPHGHQPFENDGVEGVFNAVIASSSAKSDDMQKALEEYDFFRDRRQVQKFTELPAWITAVGKTSLVPVSVAVPLACDAHHFHTKARPEDADDEICRAQNHGSVEAAWHERDLSRLAGAELDVDPDVTPPKLWHFVLALLAVTAVYDRIRQRRHRASKRIDENPTDDRRRDLALIRCKLLLYAAIRTFLFVVAFAYMDVVQMLAISTYGRAQQSGLPKFAAGCATLALLLCTYGFARDVRAFWRQYRVLRRVVDGDERTPLDAEDTAGVETSPLELSLRRATLPIRRLLGVHPAHERRTAGQSSLAQIRLIAIVTVAVAALLVVCLVLDLRSHDLSMSSLLPRRERPTPPMTLFVLRALPLTDGVSPAAPVLTLLAAIYGWVVGRMSRLRVVFDMSLVSPDDGVPDAVTTPITHILHVESSLEKHTPGTSLRATERDLLNAVIRPSTRTGYFAGLLLLAFFPFVLFWLKPPSTLESRAGTWLLVGMLAAVVTLIGATLLQLVLYWQSLQELLKRIAAHPVGRDMRDIGPYARDSLEDLVSQTPNDPLRLAAAAGDCIKLLRDMPAEVRESDLVRELRSLEPKLVTGLDNLLASQHSPELIARGDQLGPDVVRTAARLASAVFTEPSPIWPSEPMWMFSDRKAAIVEWSKAARVLVATIIALFVGRHVRQFRYFLYALTGCSILLVFAVSTYPFEPFRLMLTNIWMIMGSVVATSFWVFVRMDLNTLLSDIGNSTPGHLTLGGPFVLRVIGWVLVPLLSVAAAQYPAVANALFAWVEPFSKALH